MLRNARRRGRIAGLLIAMVAQAGLAQHTRPTTTTSPSAALTTRIDLPGGGFYWLRRPAGYTSGDRAPLVLCLHGTDDPASEAIAFWTSCGLERGAVWVAPQASGRGWSEADLPRLRETWDDLRQRVTFDADRVLLAGFSAGGAMAFHWLYREGLPVTAVVTLANYLPPAVTRADVGRRKHVPVFYGVGMEDINHERMRTGLAMLREQGVHVTLVRPPIGHTLSPEVGRDAVAWFEEICRKATRRRLDDAGEALRRDKEFGSGRAAVEAERLLSQARWHEAESVRYAEALQAQALVWGREQLEQADGLAAADRQLSPESAVEAIACLRRLERAYAGASLAGAARARREALEADPTVQRAAAEEQRRRREADAVSLYLDVQRLVAAGRFDEARQTCETIANAYADTPAADRARALLPKLPRRTTR